MPFQFTRASIPDVIIIEPKVFGDDRGSFTETYRKTEFEKAGVSEEFVQDNTSVSRRGVLRGLHYQLSPHAQGKLVRVSYGAVWDVAVDIRRGSPTFGRWVAVELSDANHKMLYIPAGFAHGFLTLSERAYFSYKCTAEYDRASEAGIRWDDPALNIQWPSRDVLVSDKDAALPAFSDARFDSEETAS